jgi:hypothetical protein
VDLSYDRLLMMMITSLCVCVRVRACAFVCGCGCTDAGVCLRTCSLTNPACNAPPYCYLSPIWLHHILTLSHKRHDFREKDAEHKMCILISSATFVGNISHSKNNSSRHCHKCRNVFM